MDAQEWFGFILMQDWRKMEERCNNDLYDYIIKTTTKVIWREECL